MTDQPTPTFADRLRHHLAWRLGAARRGRAGREATDTFVKLVCGEHDAELADIGAGFNAELCEVAETHLAAAQTDAAVIKTLRAETTRLRASLTKATTDVNRLDAQCGDARKAIDRQASAAEEDAADYRRLERELREHIASLQGELAIASTPVQDGHTAAPVPPQAPPAAPARARSTRHTAPGATQAAKPAPARTRGRLDGKTAPRAAEGKP
jgi:hypothetical protein